MTEYLTVEEAIMVNAIVIRNLTPNEPIGVSNPGGLESAIARPRQTVLQEEAYVKLEEKAAALVISMILNHPFQNANKRTALLCLDMFLKKNGRMLLATNQEAEDFVVRIAEERPHVDLQEVAHWVAVKSKER